MRHGFSGKKLNRRTNERNALFRNLVSALILQERITTTEAKAKAVRRLVDRVIRNAKESNIAAQRKVAAWLPQSGATKKLFEVMVPRYNARLSGFTRTYRLGLRRGDAAPLMVMEMVDKDMYPEKLKANKGKGKINTEETIEAMGAVEKLSKPVSKKRAVGTKRKKSNAKTN